MPDTPAPAATTSETPAPQPTSTRRARSPLNQALIDELDLAEQLAATAAKPDYASALADEGIDAAFLADLAAKVSAADTLVGSATGNTSDKKAVTRQEESLKAALLAQIQALQKRAKRKYKAADDPMREKYFIGERIESNRALLERATRAILETVKTDGLPGLKPAEVTALDAALSAYVGIQSAQSGGQSGATTARAQLEAKVNEVADKRREIQYAADLLWPAGDKANAGIRREFKIPPRKALK